MRQIFLVLFMMAAGGGSLAAQSKTEIFGGYSFLRVDSSSFSAQSRNANGWNAGCTHTMNKYVGFSADFAGQYASVEGKNASDYQFMFGPSFGYHSGTARPFARVLFGGDRLGRFGNSDTSYAIGFGGGLDLKTTKAVSLRIAQFDYIRTNHFDVAQNNLRFSAGIVFNLGESK